MQHATWITDLAIRVVLLERVFEICLKGLVVQLVAEVLSVLVDAQLILLVAIVATPERLVCLLVIGLAFMKTDIRLFVIVCILPGPLEVLKLMASFQLFFPLFVLFLQFLSMLSALLAPLLDFLLF